MQRMLMNMNLILTRLNQSLDLPAIRTDARDRIAPIATFRKPRQGYCAETEIFCTHDRSGSALPLANFKVPEATQSYREGRFRL